MAEIISPLGQAPKRAPRPSCPIVRGVSSARSYSPGYEIIFCVQNKNCGLAF